MRGDVCFIMHPQDEDAFARFVTSEAGIVFVDGPSWDKPKPPVSGELHSVGNYVTIWNPSRMLDRFLAVGSEQRPKR